MDEVILKAEMPGHGPLRYNKNEVSEPGENYLTQEVTLDRGPIVEIDEEYLRTLIERILEEKDDRL